MTTVVHVRDVLDRLRVGDPEVVYIGRANRRYGLPASIWANPHRIGPDCPRLAAVALYRGEMACRLRGPQGDTIWLARLYFLRGKTLACWCAPLACHGDVLAELAEALG